MAKSVFSYAAGGLAGAVVALSSSLTYAESLNQKVWIALEAPQSLVFGKGGATTATERSRPVHIAQAKKPVPGIRAGEQPGTAAEIVGKMLAPGASNPDVPLPHPDLAEKFADRAEVQGPLKGPTPFGRGETGGGVLGFRVPIPVDRGPTAGATTSRLEAGGLGTSPDSVLKPR